MTTGLFEELSRAGARSEEMDTRDNPSVRGWWGKERGRETEGVESAKWIEKKEWKGGG